MKVEENVALARYTTLGTGGPARAFARVESLEDLEHALRWAAEQGVGVTPVGLGSNVLVADGGVDGLVVKLAGELARVAVENRRVIAGGGAPLAVCLHRARTAGLGGMEFACAIPGTAGGGVWMNAGAYDSDVSRVLARAHVVDTTGACWRDRSELGLEYRRSGLRTGQIVAEVEFEL